MTVPSQLISVTNDFGKQRNMCDYYEPLVMKHPFNGYKYNDHHSPPMEPCTLVANGSDLVSSNSSEDSVSGGAASDHNEASSPGLSDEIPALEQFPGHYNFTFTVVNSQFGEIKGKGTSGTTYVFTDGEVPVLYAKPHPHYWPLTYSCNPQPPPNAYIRITPVYGDPDKMQNIVERCPKHIRFAPPEEKNWMRRSMVYVEKTSAHYFRDVKSRRLCVSIPYEKPLEGCSQSTVNCKFSCYNSCFNSTGGGGGKTLYLIITLEKLVEGTMDQCEVLGRRSLQFRCCACPGRDWSAKRHQPEEKVEKKQKRRRTESSGDISLTPCSDPSLDHPIDHQLASIRSNGGAHFAVSGRPFQLFVIPAEPSMGQAFEAIRWSLLRTQASAAGCPEVTASSAVRQLEQLECLIASNLSAAIGATLSHLATAHKEQQNSVPGYTLNQPMAPVPTTCNQPQPRSHPPPIVQPTPPRPMAPNSGMQPVYHRSAQNTTTFPPQVGMRHPVSQLTDLSVPQEVVDIYMEQLNERDHYGCVRQKSYDEIDGKSLDSKQLTDLSSSNSREHSISSNSGLLMAVSPS